MQRYNLTNFTSITVAANILSAMQEAYRTGLAQYVANRNGRLWLRVDIKQDDHGRNYFQFLTDSMQEVGHHLLKAALFHWPRGDEREFSGLNAALYRLPKHPLDIIIDAQEEAAKAPKGFFGKVAQWACNRLAQAMQNAITTQQTQGGAA